MTGLLTFSENEESISLQRKCQECLQANIIKTSPLGAQDRYVITYHTILEFPMFLPYSVFHRVYGHLSVSISVVLRTCRKRLEIQGSL